MKAKRMIACIVEIAIGIALWIWGVMGTADGYWSGMGGALIGMGIVQLIRSIRYQTDQKYRENMDVEAADERNRFLGMKAWSWAGFYYMVIVGVGSVALKIAGFGLYSVFAGSSVCLIALLYWLSYLYLR